MMTILLRFSLHINASKFFSVIKTRNKLVMSIRPHICNSAEFRRFSEKVSIPQIKECVTYQLTGKSCEKPECVVFPA